MRQTRDQTAGHGVRIRGFAVILHESEYLDLIARHSALDRGTYEAYLSGLQQRIGAARRTGKHVLVGPFLTDQYESYAEAIGEPPCSSQALHAYNDFVARIGPHTTAWSGEPIDSVVTALRAATDTSADQAKLLPLLKQAADQHTDPQYAASQALDTATEIFAPLLKGVEPGHHTLTCAVEFPGERISYALPVVRTPELVTFPDGGPEQLLWAALATAQLADRPATLVLRSRRLTAHAAAIHSSTNNSTSGTTSSHPNAPDAIAIPHTRAPNPTTSDPADTHPDHSVPATPHTNRRSPGPKPNQQPGIVTVRAWHLAAGRAFPLTAAQAFALACTDPATGEPIPPEPGAHYADAFPIERPPP